MSIDHINGVRHDNRASNLRLVNNQENQHNQRRAHHSSTSGLLGTAPVGRRWRATINMNDKQIHLGYFDTPEAAHKVYLEAKRRLHPASTL